jgi:hypothetical protein
MLRNTKKMNPAYVILAAAVLSFGTSCQKAPRLRPRRIRGKEVKNALHKHKM